MEKIERFVVKRADRVVVPSKLLKRVVVEWGAEEGKVRVIPNAVDARRPHLQTRSLAPAVSLTQSFGAARPSDTMPAAPRNGLGSGRLAQGRSKRIHLITIGRLVPWKGFDDAIRALRYVHKNIHDCELIVIGDGPERARLMALAAEESLESFVRFVGVIPHEHLDEYWSQAAVFVLPSGYEGFAHLVIEAWAAGVPVIASSIPANMEIIRDGATGLLAPYRYPLALADAVVRLLQDAVLRESLVMQGKKEFEKYQWTAIFDETMKVLFNK